MIKKLILSTVLTAGILGSGLTYAYDIDRDESAITFQGTHAGNTFNGEFEIWNADIDFDENNLSESTAVITIDTASAKTGNMMYDETLPSPDWFHTDEFPHLKFTAQKFEETLMGYVVTGDLQIKDQVQTMSFDFNLSGLSPKVAIATFPINRLQYNIGKKSDPSAEWVGETIDVTVKFVARPD